MNNNKETSIDNLYHSEYLLIFSEDEKLMHNEEDLITGFGCNNKLKIINNIVTFEDVPFELTVKKIKSTNEMYRSFLIHVKNNLPLCTLEEKLKFSKLNKEITDTLENISHSQLNTLQDDLASEFSIEGYKEIHKIENKMRKLITIFMSTRVGIGWTRTNTPDDVINSIKTSSNNYQEGKQPIHTFLSETDFIQLSNFLFNKYSTLKTSDVHRILNSTKKEINIDELKEFVPKSNWERYFSPEIDSIIDIKAKQKKESQITQAWEMLYELRNKVAHNKFITYEEMQKIKSKKNSIDKVIDEALKTIETIEVSNEQKKEIETGIRSSLSENIESAIDIFENTQKVKSNKGQILEDDAQKLINRLTKYIYMNINDSYKKELRKYRTKLNTYLENHKKSGSKDFYNENLLNLEISRANKYLETLKLVI